MQDLCHDTDGEINLERAKEWATLWFLKDGRSSLGVRRYASKDEATRGGNAMVDEIRTVTFRFKTPSLGTQPVAALSHFIPVPVA